uniref:GST C-terminal domain-containing protein n=1 Tax=Macrostomum lignano TaxID=282301 RepID=A0A1I8FMJ4_9PLAT
MSNQQQPANIIFESSKTLGVWGAGAAAQAQPAHSVLHAVLPVRPAHPLVLQHKQLPHQIVNLNLVRKPDWFLAKSASGSKTRTRSRRCNPGDARKRAAMRLAVGKMGDSAEWESLTRRPNAAAGPAGRFELFWRLRPGANGRPDDLALDRAAAGRRKDAGLPAAADRFDKLLGWTSRMEGQQRAVKETRISDDVHAPSSRPYWAKEYRQAAQSRHGQAAVARMCWDETAKTHWSLGSRSRQLKPNLLTLYSMRFCPFAPSARSRPGVLQHSKLPTDCHNLNLVAQTPTGFLAQVGLAGKAAFEQLVTELESMQSTLGDSKFFAGSESVQMADLMIWPWFERLKPSCSLAGFQVPEERLKSLMSWMGRMSSSGRFWRRAEHG